MIVHPVGVGERVERRLHGAGFCLGRLDAHHRDRGPGEIGACDAAVGAAAGTGTYAAAFRRASRRCRRCRARCRASQPVLCRVSSCPCRRWRRSRRRALQRSPAVRTATSPVSVNACVPPCLRRSGRRFSQWLSAGEIRPRHNARPGATNQAGWSERVRRHACSILYRAPGDKANGYRSRTPIARASSLAARLASDGRGHPRRRVEAARSGESTTPHGRSRRHDVVHVHHLRPRFGVVLPRVRRGVERDVVVAPGCRRRRRRSGVRATLA